MSNINYFDKNGILKKAESGAGNAAASTRSAGSLYRETHREKVNAYYREYFKDPENKAKHNERGKKYYMEHREEILAKRKAKRDAETLSEEQLTERKEKWHAYYLEHREKKLDYAKRWNAAHRKKKSAQKEVTDDDESRKAQTSEEEKA